MLQAGRSDDPEDSAGQGAIRLAAVDDATIEQGLTDPERLIKDRSVVAYNLATRSQWPSNVCPKRLLTAIRPAPALDPAGILASR
ncbi:MAG: hypothetical protein ACLF0P_15950 [Thermoanaerobaculia bacterium]